MAIEATPVRKRIGVGSVRMLAYHRAVPGPTLRVRQGSTVMVAFTNAIDIDSSGKMLRRRIFADMCGDEPPGLPDGMKVDSTGRVFCTGRGGIWVFEPDGTHIGTIRLPEMSVNLAFGGDDLKTLFVCAVTSVYTLRVKTPGMPHPWYNVRTG